MGNLYTHIVKGQPDKRISILAQLKREWHTYPRDMQRIKELQYELEHLQTNQNRKYQLTNSFGKKYFVSQKDYYKFIKPTHKQMRIELLSFLKKEWDNWRSAGGNRGRKNQVMLKIKDLRKQLEILDDKTKGGRNLENRTQQPL